MKYKFLFFGNVFLGEIDLFKKKKKRKDGKTEKNFHINFQTNILM